MMMLQRLVAGHGCVIAVDYVVVLADDDDDDVAEACCWPWQCRCCGLCCCAGSMMLQRHVADHGCVVAVDHVVALVDGVAEVCC